MLILQQVGAISLYLIRVRIDVFLNTKLGVLNLIYNDYMQHNSLSEDDKTSLV